MTSPQYWFDQQWNREVKIKHQSHRDVPAKTRYGQTTPAHHVIGLTDNTTTANMLIKIFPDRIQISANGTFTMTQDTLADLEVTIAECQGGSCKYLDQR